MKNRLRYLGLVISFLFIQLTMGSQLWAQNEEKTASDNKVEMADALRDNGMMMVVVAVLLIIFAVLFVYLIITERKISRLEKRVSNKN
jgi:uncharacterized membrane protein